MVQVVTSWRHVRLAQSRLPAALQSTFAHHPRADVDPGVDDILEQTYNVRGDPETVHPTSSGTESKADGPSPSTCT